MFMYIWTGASSWSGNSRTGGRRKGEASPKLGEPIEQLAAEVRLWSDLLPGIQGVVVYSAALVFEAIDRIRLQRRLTILLLEQRVVEALELCDRGYLLETGRVVLEGPREALLADARVQRAYLGPDPQRRSACERVL
jgi:hypothetical protein